MLDDLPYIDRCYVSDTFKTVVGIFISARATARDLAEMEAKVIEIAKDKKS